MDRCPPEIWDTIFTYACVDSGITGRSLSLVSRRMSEISRPMKLQSVSVIGFHQLLAFASLLETIPAEHRHVRYIFISAHARNTASDPKVLTPEYSRRTQAYAAFRRILHAIAPTLAVLHAFFIFYRPFPLVPVPLPALTELALHGPLEGAAAIDPHAHFPALRYLHLTSFSSPAYILGPLACTTPALTHLRIAAPEHAQAFVPELRAALLAAPPGLHRVFVHAPTEPKDNWLEMMDIYRHTMLALRHLEEERAELTVLPALRIGLFRTVSIQDAEEGWARSVAGDVWWAEPPSD
ncbi:hypothetical protein BD779DRAFT_1449908 [Infundibulicybe gibba]|nr:hypothetical protein BD779DRAFT_1449908 [Infundibulicybe gibba]